MKSHTKEFGFYSKCGQRPLKSFKQTDIFNFGCEKATQEHRHCVENRGKEPTEEANRELKEKSDWLRAVIVEMEVDSTSESWRQSLDLELFYCLHP